MRPVGDGRSAERTCVGTDSSGSGLGGDLAVAIFYFAVEAAVEVRIGFGGVVMVAAIGAFVAVENVELADGGAVGFSVAVDGVSIERIGYRVSVAEGFLKVERSDVVVIVVATSAMAAPIVEFAGEEGVGFAIVFDGVENGDAVGSEGYGAAEEVVFGGKGIFGDDWMEGDAPSVVSVVGLGKGDLLLPGGDADHHGVIGNAVGFDVEEVVVESSLNERREMVEGLSLFWGENWRAFGGGRHRMGSVGMLV